MKLASLTKTQRQDIAAVLQNAGFAVGAFDVVQRPSQFARGPVDSLFLKGTEYYFRFELDRDGHHWAYCSPGMGTVQERMYTQNWDRQWQRFLRWVEDLKREVEAVDPWEQIRSYLPSEEVLPAGEEGLNSRFAYAEVQAIEAALAQLESRLQQHFRLTNDQIEKVHKTVGYLKEEAKKLGRLNWKHLVIGALAELGLSLMIPPESFREFWTIVKETFQTAWFFTVSLPP